MRWSRKLQSSKAAVRRRSLGRFESLEDRRMMAVVLGQSTFSASLMGDNIAAMSTGNAVGYGYAVNYNGQTNAAADGGGQSRTDKDTHPEAFTQFTLMDISSVSKPVTATAILHLLESQPGGLDAALSTPLSAYLPSDWTLGTNVDQVTLRHLLTHTSGFKETGGVTGNGTGVDFNTVTNATYQNLQALVAHSLPAPDYGYDPTYHGQRWTGSYNNANFALLARVVLPKLIDPSIDLTAAAYPDRDQTSGDCYKQYVQNEIFEPVGIYGADLDVTDPYPTIGHKLGEDVAGEAPIDRTKTGGAGGWKMSAAQLALFLDGIRRDDSILLPATRQMRDAQRLGWGQSEDAFGEYFSHNGANGSAGYFRSEIVAMPGDVEAAFLMNSGWASLPGENAFNMLHTAYINAWTDLAEQGTSGDDNFVIRFNNDGFRPSVEVGLVGDDGEVDVEFTHWIDTLDSLTLFGGLGNDTFTIEGWNPSIDLTINGGSGDDVVSVTPGYRNIELVSGMTFNGNNGNDTIVIHDELNPYSNPNLSRVYGVSGSGVARFAANPGAPGNPGFFIPISVAFGGVENLTLNTGGQTDVIAVSGKTSGSTTVAAGGGDDVISVAQTAADLDAVDGLIVQGNSGSDSVRLFDTSGVSGGASVTGQYDVTSGSISRYASDLGGILGSPETTPVEVEFGGVENLELTTSDHVDVVRVHSTTSGATTINGGAGGDILAASPDAGNLEWVRNLTFNGEAGVDSIALNDEHNPYSHAGLSRVYSVSAGGVSRFMENPGNPALPLGVGVAFTSVEDLDLATGNQTDVVNVASTTSHSTAIHTGIGNDVINASSVDNNLESINGLSIDGGDGADVLNVHDENNPYELGPNGSVYTITPSAISRFAEHPLFDNVVVPIDTEFASVESVTLYAGDQHDEFNVSGVGSAASLTLVGHGGADQFHLASPAFAAAYIYGDSPIFLPGDELDINGDGLYATTHTPSIKTPGAGAATLGHLAIQYEGIEQADVQPQIYGGPGDFDVNGVVNGLDLTSATLGWNARFGDDLDGGDFLVWQQNFGVNHLPRGGGAAPVGGETVASESATTRAPAASSDIVFGAIELLALTAPAGGGSSPANSVESSSRAVPFGAEWSAATRAPAAPSPMQFASASTEIAPASSGAPDDKVADLNVDLAWDEAFATFESPWMALT